MFSKNKNIALHPHSLFITVKLQGIMTEQFSISSLTLAA